MDETYLTFGVVAFAILLGFAGLCWFLLADEARMEQEERELWTVEDHEGVFYKKSA